MYVCERRYRSDRDKQNVACENGSRHIYEQGWYRRENRSLCEGLIVPAVFCTVQRQGDFANASELGIM